MTHKTERLILCLTILAASFLVCTPTVAPPVGIRIALNSHPLSMDPHHTNEVTSQIVYSNIFDTLVEMNSSLVLTPRLAIKWNNPDDLTWIFDLAPNVRFQNGDALTSEDVAFSLLRVKNDPKSDWKGELAAIESIDTPSPLKVVIRTMRPYPILLNRISGIAIVPKGYVTSRGSDILEEHPVGTGPYRFVSWDKQKGVLELERSQHYYEEPPPLEKVTFLFVPEREARVRLLHSGSVDMLTDTPLEKPQLPPNIRLLKVAGLREMFMAFDMKRKQTPYVSTPANPFLDRRVRLAIYQAINTKWVVQNILGGFAEEATQFAPPNVFGYDHSLKRLPFDTESARKLMKEAGYENGFSVTLDSPNGAYFMDSTVADFMAESLRAINITVRVNKLEKATLFEKETTQDTSLYLLSWSCSSGDMEEIFDYLLRTPDLERGFGGDNGGAYGNPEVDRIVEEASRTMDSRQRRRRLQAAVAMAMNDIPWVPLYVQADLYALDNRFQWTPPADRNIRVREIQLASK